MAAGVAIRAVVRPQSEGLREDVVRRAQELGVLGWVRDGEDGTLRCTPRARRTPSTSSPPSSRRTATVASERVKVEGHEQFAIRGVSAGVFVVQEHAATAHHFDLRLEVDGVMRSWAVPKGPSLDPAVKRMAIEVEDHSMAHNDFEGALGDGGVIVWDRGTYEQGGRVAWPEALTRGHAVFVLHGEKLQGGFALQRTRRGREAAVAAHQAPRRRRAAGLGHRRRAAGVGRQRPDARRFCSADAGAHAAGGPVALDRPLALVGVHDDRRRVVAADDAAGRALLRSSVISHGSARRSPGTSRSSGTQRRT